MKTTIFIVLGAVCFPALADEPTAAPSSAAKAAQPAASTFCGHAEMQRLFLKTEIGKRLQLRQQKALREEQSQAMFQAVSKGEISVQEYMQWLTAQEQQEETVQK